jgi:hypothetical protein
MYKLALAFALGGLIVWLLKPTYDIPVNSRVIEKQVHVRDRSVAAYIPPVIAPELIGYPVYLKSDSAFAAIGVECSSFKVDTILRGDTISVLADCYQKALRNLELRFKPAMVTVRDSFVYVRDSSHTVVEYTPFFTVSANVGRTFISPDWEFGLNASFSFANLSLVPELTYTLGSGLEGKASIEFLIMEK